MNTVHVRDVARAMWHVATRPDAVGQIYNVVDEGDSTQGSISAAVSELFNINHDYWGTALSTLAKVCRPRFRKNLLPDIFHLYYVFSSIMIYILSAGRYEFRG